MVDVFLAVIGPELRISVFGGRDCLIPNVRKREELSPRKNLERASSFSCVSNIVFK